MDVEKVQILDNAVNMYNNLMDKIKEVYIKSDEFMLPKKPELDDVLYDAKKYMKQVFNCIANATGEVTTEEQAFIDKLGDCIPKDNHVDAELVMESTFSNIPKYIELANEVDKLAETNYARALVDDTLAICKELMDIDGNTYYDESSFTHSFIDMLKKYIKDN